MSSETERGEDTEVGRWPEGMELMSLAGVPAILRTLKQL